MPQWSSQSPDTNPMKNVKQDVCSETEMFGSEHRVTGCMLTQHSSMRREGEAAKTSATLSRTRREEVISAQLTQSGCVGEAAPAAMLLSARMWIYERGYGWLAIYANSRKITA